MSNWEGQPEATEHRTLGQRAWCYQDKTYCYPSVNCDCCHVAKGWLLMWLLPDGVLVDENEDVVHRFKTHWWKSLWRRITREADDG